MRRYANLVISSVRRSSHTNVAAALRRDNALLMEAFTMIGLTNPAKRMKNPWDIC